VPTAQILRGIPSEFLAKSADILAAGFPLKMRHELRARTPRQAALLVEQSIAPDLGWVALDPGGDVLGVLGVDTDGLSFFNWRYPMLARELGLLSAIPARFFTALGAITTRPGRGLWRIEVIAVDEQARGGGVGTRLLRTAIEAARDTGMRAVTLEVVDTNEPARALYERLGFRCVRTQRSGWLTAQSGYQAIRYMRLDL